MGFFLKIKLWSSAADLPVKVFLKLNTVNETLTSYRQLTRQSSLDRHPCRVFYDKVEFWLFNGLVRFWGPNPVRLKTQFQFGTSGIFYSYINTNNCKGGELFDHFWHFWPTLMHRHRLTITGWSNLYWQICDHRLVMYLSIYSST